MYWSALNAVQNAECYNVQCFYRDQSVHYYADIVQKSNNIMRKKIVDYPIHKGSPMFNHIQGIFFHTNIDYQTLMPYTPSIYGECRLEIPVQYIFNIAPNLYFGDFCISSKSRRVTLVMCRPNSPEDHFCRMFMIPLNPFWNPFLVFSMNPQSKFPAQVIGGGMWVEVVVTEDINILDALDKGGDIHHVDFRGKKG